MTATMWVDVAAGPDADDKFAVFAHGAAMRLDLDTIKWHIGRGDDVRDLAERAS